MSDFEQEMLQYEEEWAEAQENAGSGGPILAPGDYQARVTVARVEINDWDAWTLTLQFEDLGGKGRVTVWDNLDQEVGRSIAASHTKAMGYEGNLAGIKAACESGFFDDLVCDIRVKDNPKKDDESKVYKVVYVNRCHGKGEGTSTGGGDFVPAAAQDDDIPF